RYAKAAPGFGRDPLSSNRPVSKQDLGPRSLGGGGETGFAAPGRAGGMAGSPPAGRGPAAARTILPAKQGGWRSASRGSGGRSRNGVADARSAPLPGANHGSARAERRVFGRDGDR